MWDCSEKMQRKPKHSRKHKSKHREISGLKTQATRCVAAQARDVPEAAAPQLAPRARTPTGCLLACGSSSVCDALWRTRTSSGSSPSPTTAPRSSPRRCAKPPGPRATSRSDNAPENRQKLKTLREVEECYRPKVNCPGLNPILWPHRQEDRAEI